MSIHTHTNRKYEVFTNDLGEIIAYTQKVFNIHMLVFKKKTYLKYSKQFLNRPEEVIILAKHIFDEGINFFYE